MIPLIVSIDTEEDNWESVWTGASVENVRELPRLARFFEGLGIRPTYFVSYQVVRCAWAAGILREIAAGGRAEIAAHVHPWNTPPFDETAPARATMLRNYTLDQQTAKVRAVTEALAEAIGTRPASFRAGRFGLGPETITALVRNGYRVDSSVTPFWSSAADDHGPDFNGAPISCYRLDGSGDVRVPVADGAITEVPVSAGFTRFAVEHWPRLHRLGQGSTARALHLASIAARARLVKRSILSPEDASVKEMLALSRCLVAAGASHLQMILHSSSLRPGLTPFVRSRAELERLYRRLGRYVDALSRLSPIVFKTVGEVVPSAAPVPSVASCLAQLGDTPPSVAAPQPLAHTRRGLLLNPEFAPDGEERSSRWAGLTKYLVRTGWEVHVQSTAGRAGHELWEGVQTHRGPAGMLGAAARGRILVHRFGPDVVLTSGRSLSAHIAGSLATFGTGIPLAIDVRGGDWSDNHSGLSRTSRSFLARLLYRQLEYLLLRNARHLITDSVELANALRELSLGTAVTVLRSGVDFEQLPQGRSEALPRLSVAYAGDVRDDGTIDPILRAFRLFLDMTPEAAASSKLRIARPVAAEHAVQIGNRIRHYRLERHVELLRAVRRRDSAASLAACQIAVVLPPGESMEVPEELYLSLGLGVPTLVCGDSDSAAAKEAMRLGALLREPQDVEGIARAFQDGWHGRLLPGYDARADIDYHPLAKSLGASLIEGARTSTRLPETSATADASSAPTVQGEPRANWIWLADLSPTNRALELTVGPSALASALQLQFAEVEVHDCSVAPDTSPMSPVPAARTGRFQLPFLDQLFDCVAIQGAWPEVVQLEGAVHAAQHVAALRECRRLLRPGGCLYLAGANARYRRLAVWAPHKQPLESFPSLGEMRRELFEAGFSRLQAYYVSPSHLVPRDIVPADRSAVARYERVADDGSGSSWLRRGMAALGLHQILYPSVLYLAFR